MKMAFATSKRGFRPQMSEHLAHRGADTVLANVYELPTQVYCAAVASKRLAMVGRAVATMVMSSAARN
jgi:hypothetical protein